MRTIYGTQEILRIEDFENPVLAIIHDGNKIPIGMTLKDSTLPQDDPKMLVDQESETGRVFFREADDKKPDDNPNTRIIVPAGARMAKDAPFYSVRKTDNPSFVIVDFHGDKEIQDYAVFVTDITDGIIVWDFRADHRREFTTIDSFDIFATQNGLKPTHRWNGKNYEELKDAFVSLTPPDDSEII